MEAVMDEIFPKPLTDVPLLHGVEQRLVLMRIPPSDESSVGDSIPGDLNGFVWEGVMGCKSMARFYLGDDSGFPKEILTDSMASSHQTPLRRLPLYPSELRARE